MIKVLEKYKKRIDIPLFAITFVIIFLGLVTLSGSNLDTPSIIINQVINIFIGLIIFTILIFTNPRILFSWAPMLFLITIFLLILVHFFGVESNGAK
ncbi:MAG: FtsW/RodA/SpoVE family cell cycle protein, partial [Methylophilaceae bacterium]|nr:FtsW/RodA/SpoVE family cell cycle protein [Methylophilaceae bacterium]